MKRYKKYFSLLLIAIGFLVFLAFMYFANSQVGKSQRKQIFSFQSLPFLGDITPDPKTENWKTFKAPTRLGISFSVKYPANWFYTTQNPSNTAFVPIIVFSPKSIPNVYTRKEPCFSIRSGIYGDDLGDLIMEWDSATIASPSAKYDKYGVPDLMVHEIINTSSLSRIVINGMEGVERKVLRFGEESLTEQIFLKGDLNSTYGVNEYTFYTIESCSDTDPTIFGRMLSTFKKNN